MDHHNKIKDYFEDKLSPEEARRFEEALKTDKELADATDRYFNEQTIGGKAVKEHLREYHLKRQFEVLDDTQIKKKRLRSYAVAAGVLFLILAGSFLIYSNLNFSNRAFADESIVIPEYYTRNKNVLTPIKRIQFYISEGKIEEAKALYERSDFDTLNSPNVFLMGGYLYLKNNENKKALALFEGFLVSEEITSLDRQNAEWHRILALLKNSETEKARKALQNLPTEHDFHAEAQKLLNKLDHPLRKVVFTK